MNERIHIGRDGLLSYHYDTQDGIGRCVHLLTDTPLGIMMRFKPIIETRGIIVKPKCALPFFPFLADFAQNKDAREEVEENALMIATDKDGNAGPWFYWSSSFTYYVIHKYSRTMRHVGPVGGPKRRGQGTNYCDRAKELARKLNREARDAYRPYTPQT